MSHCWASSFVQLIFTLGRMRVGEHVVHIKYLINLLLSFVNWVLGFRIKNCTSFLVANMLGLNCRQFPEDSLIGLIVAFKIVRRTSITMSQRSRAKTSSIRSPLSRKIVTDSVELCETEVCFSHIQLTGINVLLPKIHKTPPEVDFEPSRSPAKSEFWNKPNLQCCAVYSTCQFEDSDSCDEPRKLALLVVCHMPGSILWLLLHVWWLTIK